MRISSLILAITLSVAATGAASAADIAARPAATPAAPAAYDWSGFYFGGHVGGGWSTTSFADPSAAQVFANCCFQAFFAPGAAATDANASSFLGGVQAGWMYQIGRLVIGNDLDWSATNMRGHGSGFFPAAPGFVGSGALESYSANTKWVATATTTIGFASDRWMYYGKAGAALADNSYGLGVFIPDNTFGGTFNLSSPGVNAIVTGWTVGAGVKWALATNWFASVEYDFVDFGSKEQNFNAVCSPSPCSPGGSPATATFNPTFNQYISEVKLGLDYKFDPGFAAPAYASADLTAPFAKLPGLLVTKAPPKPVAYDWTGFYLGGHIGAGWSTTAFVDPAAAQVLANCCVLNGLAPGASASNANASGFLGGLQAGWMYQLGRLVVGNDIDWSATGMNGHGSGFFPPGPLGAANNCAAPCNATEAYGVDTRWTATATTTIGLAKDRWMFYNKGGVALADNRYSLGVTGTTSGFGVTPGPYSLVSSGVNGVVAGWTIGTGVKWAYSDNWFLNVEYDFLEFGSKAQNFSAVCGPSPCPNLLNMVTTATFNPTFDQHISEIKVGLNYKFDPGLPGSTSTDSTVRLVTKAPAATGARDWTGAYVGGHIGGGLSTTAFADPGAGQILANCCELTNLAPQAAATNANAGGFLGGAQAGWMYQIGRAVVGGDFDWSATTMRGHGSGVFPPSTTGITPATETYSVDTRWTATTTTTIGLAGDRWMYYGKAGAAFADNSYGLAATGIGAVAATPFSLTSPGLNAIVTGWTVGTGVKWALADNWFANVEYDFLDFGSKAQNIGATCQPAVCVAAVNTTTGATFNPTFNQHISEFKVGLNYKFSPGFLFW